ncbi:MAG: hypothetical protein ACFFC0_03535 [Promethearchaeota archaeon]
MTGRILNPSLYGIHVHLSILEGIVDSAKWHLPLYFRAGSPGLDPAQQDEVPLVPF